MTNYELYHHGILGMKWGIRRFQKKDGSLTALGKKRRGDNDEKKETLEERRARVLKSSNASEIYKNKDILTTAEINERINRIETEKRLAYLAESTKKTGMQKVDTALKWGRKINEVYEFTNTPVMKALKKKLGFEPKNETPKTLAYIYKNRDKLSDNTLNSALKRANTEKAIKKLLDEAAAINAKQNKERAAKEAEQASINQERNTNKYVSDSWKKKTKTKTKWDAKSSDYSYDGRNSDWSYVDKVASTPVKSVSNPERSRGESVVKDIVNSDIGDRPIAGYLPGPIYDDKNK